LHLLDGADFLRVEVDSFGCNDKPKKFTGYPQEGFGGIHLQLMRPHDIEYCLQIYYVIAIDTIFYCNIVYVAFHCFAYILVENYIHSSLVCRPLILQPEGHHSIEVHSQWCPKGCILLIVRVHLNLIVFRESVDERYLFKPTCVVQHDIRD